MCPPDYHQSGSMATYALGHMMYSDNTSSVRKASKS